MAARARPSLEKACAVAAFERSYLAEMLAQTSGNVSLAARLAKKDRGAFNKLLKKHRPSITDSCAVRRA